MPEREFIPFSPRRLERPTAAAVHASPVVEAKEPDAAIPLSESHDLVEDKSSSSDQTSQQVADVASDNNDELSKTPLNEDGELSRASQEAASLTPSDEDAPQMLATTVDVSTVNRCDHACEIRNEAVRLASIACGRALRRAVMLHPRVIAAFVDDALRSAGTRQVQSIRVHSDVAPHVEPSLGPLQIADDLSPGDVFIDLDSGTIGARLETRAELLVAAAAES